jgi:xylitol oxidase
MAADNTTVPHANWAGNLAYGATHRVAPASVAEAQAAVRAATKLTTLGTRHCFNAIADTAGTHLSLARLNRILALDRTARTVTVEGGIRYGELGPALAAEGFALANLASLPHISIAGAIATATHGSGARLGNLAAAVTALEFIAADGGLAALSRARDGDRFAGAVVHLGVLGPVTQLTLAVEPLFHVRQDVYLDLPFAALAENFAAVMDAGYSVSLFTDWRGDAVRQAWVKRRTVPDDAAPAPADFFGARPATTKMHPLAGVDPTYCTEQAGRPGPWHERLPHFRMEFTPSRGDEIQAEYFVDRQDAVAAIAALRTVGDTLAPVLMISEIRAVAADDLWLSPACRRDVAAFHFTFHRDWPAVRAALPAIEGVLAPFAPRPHWGKVFALAPAEIAAGYPRLADFRALAAAHDPAGKFRNAFLETYVFGET